jgi:hypothetical protein
MKVLWRCGIDGAIPAGVHLGPEKATSTVPPTQALPAAEQVFKVDNRGREAVLYRFLKKPEAAFQSGVVFEITP